MITGHCSEQCQSLTWADLNVWAKANGFLTSLFPGIDLVPKGDDDHGEDQDELELSVTAGLWQPIAWSHEVDRFIGLGVSNQSVQSLLQSVSNLGDDIRASLKSQNQIFGRVDLHHGLICRHRCS